MWMPGIRKGIERTITELNDESLYYSLESGKELKDPNRRYNEHSISLLIWNPERN